MKEIYSPPKIKKVSFEKDKTDEQNVHVNEIPVGQRAVISTLARMTEQDIADLQKAKGESPEIRGDVFKEKIRQLWSEIAVHGVMRKDRKSGESKLVNFSDLDGDTCIGLLELAKIKVKDIKHVNPGDYLPGRINFDTGNRYGFIVEDDGKTVFLDHHGPHAENGLSGTRITYEALISLGLLKKDKYLDDLVDFVTNHDNKTFPEDQNNFTESYRTLIGLNRFVKFPKLLQFFKDGKKPTDLLTETELIKYGFINKQKNIDRSAEQKGIVKVSFEHLDKLEKAGFIVPSDRYGKIVIDIGKKISGGFDAVVAYGADSYIIWNPKDDNFFISTKIKLTDTFSQGIKVRETMWIKPLGDGVPLELTLDDILKVLTDAKLELSEKLEQFLDAEQGEREVAAQN